MEAAVEAGKLFAGTKNKARLGEIAAQVRGANPRTLDEAQTSDLITLIEFMQKDVGERFDELMRIAEDIGRREAEVTKRELEVAAAMRLLNLKPAVAREKAWFWR